MHVALWLGAILPTEPSHFWDGFGGEVAGALIGGAVSAVVAWLVVVATRQNSERSEQLKASREAAGQLTVALYDARQQLQQAVLQPTYYERAELRRTVADVMAQQVALYRPALSDEHLRSMAADAHDSLLDFIDRCQRPEDAAPKPPKRPGFSGGPPQARRNLWQAEALPVLSAYISAVVARLEQHRQGKPVSSDPIPAPVWPNVDPPLEAPAAPARSGGAAPTGVPAG